MSYSNTVPPSGEELFYQAHQDIHDNNKAKHLIIRELTRKGLSYTEAQHMVDIAAYEPNPKLALDRFKNTPAPRRPISSYRSDRPDHPSGCLALYLGANFIFSAILLVVLLVNPEGVFGGGDIPGIVIISTFIVGIATLVGTVGAWNFQKWGIYTLIGLSCMTLGLNGVVGASVASMARPIFRIILVVALVSPQWDNFE